MTVYVAGLALIAAVAWMVSRPFFATAKPVAPFPDLRDATAEGRRWRRDEALAAIRDADFDYQTGKLTESDYRELRARLDRRALETLDALDRGASSGEPR